MVIPNRVFVLAQWQFANKNSNRFIFENWCAFFSYIFLYTIDYSRYDDQRHYGEKEDSGLFEVVQCPTDAAALTNFAYIAPGVIDPKVHYVVIAHQYVLSVR